MKPRILTLGVTLALAAAAIAPIASAGGYASH